jgi:DNA polymerase III sliding clamp (beta) subunit (PCNA family)
MTTTLKLQRDTFIKSLSGIKDDNVSIAGVTIGRKVLLEALKLQDTDILNINYGRLSWQDENDNSLDFKPEYALQFTCGRQTLRFLNRPRGKHAQDKEPIFLNFVDHAENKVQNISGVAVDTRGLLDALIYTLPCVATETNRPLLNCICFESKDNTLTLAAADGYRLATAKLSVKDIPEFRVNIHSQDISRLIVFLKNLKYQGRGKAKTYPEVYLSLKDDFLTFMSSDNIINLPLQTGNFPAYSQLIPSDGTRIECIASELNEAVKALSPYCRNGSGIIRLQFSIYNESGRIKVSARSEEFGESATEVDAIVQADCRIAMNHKYLIALLNLCGDNRIVLKMTTSTSPIVFETSEDHVCVLMPMSVNWSEADVKPKIEQIMESEQEQKAEELVTEYLESLDNRDLVEANQI